MKMKGLPFAFALILGSAAMAQPKMCKYDEECHTGFYCVQGTFNCRECLDCEGLKRNPPLVPSLCIKSVAQCGSCIKGLVEDLRADVNAKCVPPDGDPISSPSYVGWIVGGLLFFIVVVLIFIYLLSRTDYLKILASTRASVRSPCGSTVASAPELPPPYSAHYAPVPSASPGAGPPRDPPDYDPEAQRTGENALPIKRVPSTRGNEARESDGNQATVPFNNPNYVRGPVLPSVVLNEPTDRETFTVHDEDTMESDWTPAAPSQSDVNGNAVSEGAGPGELAAALAERPSSALVPFSARDSRALSRQDKNNNRNNGESSSVDTSRAGRPAFYINTVVNIKTVQQQNDYSQ